VPFFEEPAIQLRSLARLPTPSPCGATRLRAEWRLTCWLRLPWAPYIDIEGSTTYVLNEEENQVGRGGVGRGRVAACTRMQLCAGPVRSRRNLTSLWAVYMMPRDPRATGGEPRGAVERERRPSAAAAAAALGSSCLAAAAAAGRPARIAASPEACIRIVVFTVISCTIYWCATCD
jgi:hypothetical protein